ncbi:deoxyribodipyrimidine photolyase [Vibrio chagasii]|uniref:Cryptochrome DASH n=1 Tax=Vibrio chagasii TaxID=170679 RepID=A0A2S7VGH3_9VIBR|nr:DASH family cryptochrome [Vibrio chagasii]PQJ60581.1 deoxyribodipyrimidine photolyase [Vibrio chagasii]
MKKIGLYLFTNDLRINDNTLLYKASQSVDELLCVAVEPRLSTYSVRLSQEQENGAHRHLFIKQAIDDLASSLARLGQRLLVLERNTSEDLVQLVKSQQVTHFFASSHCAHDERQLVIDTLTQCPGLFISQQHHTTLFESDAFPFELTKLPRSFTKFRLQVEYLEIEIEESVISSLPPAPQTATECYRKPIPELNDSKPGDYIGGETVGLIHLENYFSNDYAGTYKQTRNALDGIENSTKFSPWLALGCVSPKTIYRHLKQFEAHLGANDSTYWIYFELLWREYFYWKCLTLGTSLFGRESSDLPNEQLLDTTSGSSFAKWKSGNTNYPIVDACMRQLNATGYMSNRGRQLVASCLIHELGIDWRHGAAYFESQLIDYDVASNWGNWAYIAGALNPQAPQNVNKQRAAHQSQLKSRHFDLVKQTEMYDPEHAFINKWHRGDEASTSTRYQDVI